MVDGVLSKSKRKNYLWVEGKDDEGIMYSLLNSYLVTSKSKSKLGRFIANDEFFEIKEHNGLPDLLKALKVELKGDVVDNRYGVVVDADDKLDSIWQKLQGILSASGYSAIPTVPSPEGTILKQGGSPVIGIWIMPDNKLPGMIEDFIGFLGPQKDELWPLAVDVVQKVISTKCNFRPSYKSKACLHTWLAWQEEPGRPMGQAITKKYVDVNAVHAQQLIAWFRKLFDLEGK